MRKKIIIGNWKMNMTQEETRGFLESIKGRINTKKVDVVFAVPFTDIEIARETLYDTDIAVGAQNVHFEPRGACTGEISIEMLKELGVNFCIVGHSERRTYFNETDITVNKKVRALLENGLIPVICVGEDLKTREANKQLELVEMQVKKAIADIDIRNIEKIIIAYEPLWAIGTGKTATPEQAEEMCSYIRYVVAQVYGVTISENIRIQYGGSVNSENAESLFGASDIDGALVGGASLKPEFINIVNAAVK